MQEGEIKMCNLNILIRRNFKRQVTPFLMAVSSNSFIGNDDGDGFYCSSNDNLVKSMNKLNYYKYVRDIETSKFIITHQRIATSGRELAYNQPFQSLEFAFVHNGIINSFLRKEGSDSWGFFLSFQEKFKQTAGRRDERIISTIKSLLGNDSGYYSIFIYDKVTGKGYYFKNSSARINFYRFLGMIFITTEANNSKFLSLLGDVAKDSVKSIDVKSNRIYKIFLDTETIRVYDMGKIKEENIVYKSSVSAQGFDSRLSDWQNPFQDEEELTCAEPDMSEEERENLKKIYGEEYV